MSFGEELRKLRETAGYESQAKLAEASGVDNSTIARLERNETKPTPATLQKLAPFLKVPYMQLMEIAGHVPLEYIQRMGRVVRKGFRSIEEAIDDNEIEFSPVAGAMRIGEITIVPIIGAIRAGTPLLARETVEGYKATPKENVQAGDYFYLRVKGDSMAGRIQEGDLVLIRCQEEVENGEIAVVMVNDEEATLKRVYRTNGQLVLQSDNTNYAPIIIDSGEVRICGKVVKVEFEPTKKTSPYLK